MRIGSGSTIDAAPASQQPCRAVIERAAGRAEDGHVVAGGDAPGLEGGADGTGLLVELRPGEEVAVRAGHGGTDEPDARRAGRGALEPA